MKKQARKQSRLSKLLCEVARQRTRDQDNEGLGWGKELPEATWQKKQMNFGPETLIPMTFRNMSLCKHLYRVAYHEPIGASAQNFPARRLDLNNP
jgi:hypothetical protein